MRKVEHGDYAHWTNVSCLICQRELEAENVKLRAERDESLIGHLRAVRENEEILLQIRAAEPVIGAARLMVRHQVDRHELSSCCNDVTPTNAYLLRRALEEWDATQKTNTEKRNHPCPKCGHEPETHGQLCRCTDPVCLEIDAEQRRALKGLGR